MAKKTQRIQTPSPKKGRRISAETSKINYDERPPVFSLERLQKGRYCLQSMDVDGKSSFADSIFRRKNTTWKDIKKADKHGLGFEKIAKNSIKAAKPACITEDLDDYLSFRFSGKKPMVGYRKQDVFYVLWFDHDFTLYKH